MRAYLTSAMTLKLAITINTVILAAQEIIFRNGLYNEIINENLLDKVSLDKQNFHKKWDSIEDDLCSYRLSNDLSMSVWLCVL